MGVSILSEADESKAADMAHSLPRRDAEGRESEIERERERERQRQRQRETKRQSERDT
jgi:hypothetical protein